MKILLACDGSPFSVPPVRAAVNRPWPPGSMIRVLAVAETPFPVAPEVAVSGTFVEEQATILRKDAEATLKSVRDTITKRGLPLETRIREGSAGQQIVEEAKEWGADLILLGSHGRTGLKRVLMGSVAQYVVAHAPCSVEVVRETGGARAETSGNLRAP